MNTYGAKIIADSISWDGTEYGPRLTTMEICIPKFIQAELNTHRVFSRNSASSRAIPSSKIRQRIFDTPVIPVWWGKNQSGMKAREEVDEETKAAVHHLWLEARNVMLAYQEKMESLGLHKQISNRLVEPWMFVNVIITSTEWENFFTLRNHPDAQPEFAIVAKFMKEAMDLSSPKLITKGNWHIPYIYPHEEILPLKTKLIKSVARCARVSYLNHENNTDFEKDASLYQSLKESGHWSPFEHQATPHEMAFKGNFTGWDQFRHMEVLL